MPPRPARVIVVGRSPSVLTTSVDLLRSRGYDADATNQFADLLDDYDVSALDVLVFGGMVPAETKQRLREEIARRSPEALILQGLVGIPGVIATQVEESLAGSLADGEVSYDTAARLIRVRLAEAATVSVEALWMTSWTPPEPTSDSLQVFHGALAAGRHEVALPAEVPAEASFAAVRVGTRARVLTLGPMPSAVARMVPRSAEDHRLPDVAAIATGRRGRPRS